MIASFIFGVTVAHRHTGTIGAEQEDPCFAPWAFKSEDLCGLPRTFHTQAVTMALTSLEQARIMDNYEHLFPEEKGKELWRTFQHKLDTTVRDHVNTANTRRKRE